MTSRRYTQAPRSSATPSPPARRVRAALHDVHRRLHGGPRPTLNGNGDTLMNDYLRKRMLAVNVLLDVPEDIPDGLESELYCYRDTLEAEALSA